MKDIKAEDLFDLRRILLLPEGHGKISDYAAAKPDTMAFGKLQKIAGNEPKPVSPGADESFSLTPATASIHGAPMTLLPAQDSLGGWTRPEHAAIWEVRGIRGGTYDIHADWAMPDVSRSGMQSARITVDGQNLRVAPIRTTGGADRYASYIIGTVRLPDGDHRISFGPNGVSRSAWMRLRSLRFVPANQGKFVIPPLSVPEGFEITPAAIPPLVQHPMMACLDDQGRMFISESAGINAKAPELLQKRPHKILMLEDKNNDGVYDKSSVFAENLVLPNGAQCHNGSLYVGSPPYVWKFTDTNGDEKADKQTPINGKFGFNGMSSAFHGPVLGPDGRLYWCGGQHGWTLGDPSPGFDLKGPWTSRAPGVFSSWPDGTDTENRAHGGLANPVEVTFSAEGEVFGTVAVYDGVNGRHDAVLHWMHGAKYNLNRSRGNDLPQTSYPILPPVSRRGWVAPPGLTRYRSGAFGKEYKDDIFLAEFNTHRVYRLQLERNGASFSSADQIFLESSSPYSHFTDVFEDADGSLLVVDTGGWFLYGCPTSSIEKPEVRGAIYRIRKKGQIARADPRGLKVDWAKTKPATLTEFLDDSRFVVRDKAIQQLALHNKAAIPALSKTISRSKNIQTRRNAVWTLTRIHTPHARSIVRDALKDESFSVRLTAARSISTHRDKEARGRLEELVIADEPAVRRECATALRRIGDKRAVPALLHSLATAPDDRFLQHALIYAMIEIGDAPGVREGLNSSEPLVQQGALVALDEMKNGGLKPDDLSAALSSTDVALRGHAIRIATARKWSAPITGHLRKELARANEDSRAALADALISFTGDPAIQRLIDDAFTNPNLSSSAKRVLLDVTARTGLKKLPETWKKGIIGSFESKNPRTVLAAIAAADRWKPVEATPRLLAIARAYKLDASVRVAAIDALPAGGDALPDDLFELLLSELNASTLPARRSAAAQIVASNRLTGKQRGRLLPAIAKAGPLEFAELISAFRSDTDPASGAALLKTIAKASARSSLSPEQIEGFASRYKAPTVSELAKPIVAELKAAASDRESRLAELEAGLLPGNPDRGVAAFTKAACNVCHKVRGNGGAIGPDLSQIGGIRTTRDLLEAIAYPNATFAREYQPMAVLLKNDEVLTGRIIHEDETTIDLMNVAGEVSRIERAKIQAIETSAISLMPAGLEQALTNQELSDLISYLRGLK